MKLWVDDFRDAPDDSWTEVRKVEPAIKAIAMFAHSITDISLDHDIENRPDDETFKPVAYYIAEKYWQRINYPEGTFGVMRPGLCPKITIHSDNPAGAREMQLIFKDRGIEAPWEPFTSHKDFKKKFGLE